MVHSRIGTAPVVAGQLERLRPSDGAIWAFETVIVSSQNRESPLKGFWYVAAAGCRTPAGKTADSLNLPCRQTQGGVNVAEARSARLELRCRE